MSPLLLIPAATFLYLLFDLYTVINSVSALLRSISFWLLWLLFTILNSVAVLLFQATALKALLPIVSPTAATFLTVFFTTIGAFSILQSFTVRLGDYKPVDFQKIFENLRTTVLAQANRNKAELAKSSKLRLARKLTTYYEHHPQAIEEDYERLMSFGPRAQGQVSAEITAAEANPRGKIPTLVNTMVLADEAGARDILP